MLENITKIDKYGIFQGINKPSNRHFVRYNLIFGWNGSGKSILSTLFRCLETKEVSPKFPEAKFSIAQENGSPITQSNLNECDLNISVFNRDFIDKHIDWNRANSILIMGKEEITGRAQLEELKKQQEADEDAMKKEHKLYLAKEQELSKFMTNGARRIKDILRSIDTNDKHYLNYNKSNFEKFVKDNEEKIKSSDSVLSKEETTKHTHVARPQKKEKISLPLSEIDSSQFSKVRTKLSTLFSTNIAGQTIKRLAENTDIQNWVKTGLELHLNLRSNQSNQSNQSNRSNDCEFCGQPLSDERIKELEGHFNNEYNEFQQKLNTAKEWLPKQQCLYKTNLPEEPSLYDEFRSDYDKSTLKLTNAGEAINRRMEDWQIKLNGKIANPFDTSMVIKDITAQSIKDYNLAIQEVNAVIEKHNHKTANFEAETEQSKKILELHYVAIEVNEFGYYEKKTLLADQENTKTKLTSHTEEQKNKIRRLEGSLSNASLGANKFNERLHRFLGRSDISLRFSEAEKGYEILRNEKVPVKGNLSEGEKTAMAFVYFVTKLYENDNKIEDTIVVVDDPVSSFDSNHLFFAYIFLKKHCEKAQQLFVLTHNFTYFKSIRDWFVRLNRKNQQNKRNKEKDQNIQDVGMFYNLKVSNNLERSSILEDANDALIKYNSEYHYIFHHLNNIRHNNAENTNQYLLAANLSRKILESFLSFKYPKGQGGFSNLFEHAINKSSHGNNERKERMRKFVNYFSHSDSIGTDENRLEVLMSEGRHVVNDVLEWIEELDPVHYDEMMQVVSSNHPSQTRDRTSADETPASTSSDAAPASTSSDAASASTSSDAASASTSSDAASANKEQPKGLL